MITDLSLRSTLIIQKEKRTNQDGGRAIKPQAFAYRPNQPAGSCIETAECASKRLTTALVPATSAAPPILASLLMPRARTLAVIRRLQVACLADTSRLGNGPYYQY
jgi:hypothetical protein